MKTTAAWSHVLYFFLGWMSKTMTKCFSCIPRVSKGSLIPEETLIKHTYSYYQRSLKQQKQGKTFPYEALILQKYTCSASLTWADLLSLKSPFKSLSQGCPQLMRVTRGYCQNWWGCLLFNIQRIQVSTAAEWLKRVLPIIVDKKSSTHNPQNTLEILDIIF